MLSTGIKNNNNNNNLTCQVMVSNELFFSLSYRKKLHQVHNRVKPFRQPLMVQGCIIYIRNLPINPGSMLPTQSSSISAKIARYFSQVNKEGIHTYILINIYMYTHTF